MNDRDGMWICLFKYPQDKELIKNSIMEMAQTVGYELQDYIEYCIEEKDLDSLKTVEEYWEDFKLTEKERDNLVANILALKLSL